MLDLFTKSSQVFSRSYAQAPFVLELDQTVRMSCS